MFDEIITGFRLASGGAQEYYGVKADLATYGKVPGGGVPLGIIAGTDEVMAILESTGDPARDLRERAYFGGTFNAGVLVTAVGVAVLHHLREYPEVYDQVNRLGAGMRERLDVVIREADVPAVVVGDGSLFGVRFVEEPVRSVRDLVDENKAASGAMQALLLRRGVFVTPSLGLLSAAHIESDLDEIAEAFQGSFAVLRSVGVFDSA
jgi:glutamate-1-semialdehyde aminotransferase